MRQDLDDALALTPTGANLFSADVSTSWWTFDAAYGGWALALAARAVAASDGARGELVSLNAIFPAAIREGKLRIAVELTRKRARTDFWSVALFPEATPDEAAVKVDLVMTSRRKSDLTFASTRPDATPFADCPEFNFGGFGPRWCENYDQRLAAGEPFNVNDRPLTRMWIKDVSERTLDVAGLIAMSDTTMPRTFLIAKEPVMSSTVSFSMHILATTDEIAAQGSEPIMIEGDSDAVRDGAYDERSRLWGADGRLLAVSNQLAFYR
ncbi:MAG: thioesterase family protein [Pseudomonadota bacterium]